MDEIKIRTLSEKDIDFIFATWLRSYRHSSRFAERISNEVYFDWHKKIIEIILKKPTTTVLIAHLPDDPNVILGYFCFERRHMEDVAHFLFIKKAFRNLRIATRLFEESGLDPQHFCCTHWTHPMNSLVRKVPRISYNPYNL